MVEDTDEGADRREHQRRMVCIALDVGGDEHRRHAAVARDLSESGAYFYTRAPLTAGERLTLSLRFASAPDAVVQETEADVIRVDALPKDRAHLWTHGVAVRFPEPLTETAPAIDKAADILARWGYDD